MFQKPGNVELVERLPYTPPLLDDELLSSWIARIEAYYLMHGVLRRWLVRDVIDDPGKRIVGNVAGLFDIDPTDGMLARLGQLTGLAPGLLRSRTLLAIYPGLQANDFAQSISDTPKIRSSRVGYCEVCAFEMTCRQEGQYLRSQWAIVWQTICPRHNVRLRRLREFCGNCESSSPTLTHDSHSRYICQSCGRDRLEEEFWPSLRTDKKHDKELLASISHFEQQTLDALSTGRGQGPWAGIGSPEPVRRFLNWFVDFTGRLEQWGRDGTAPRLWSICPVSHSKTTGRGVAISTRTLPYESMGVRQLLNVTLTYFMAGQSVRQQISPERHYLATKGLIKRETRSGWLLENVGDAIASVPRAEIDQFAPLPRILVRVALRRYLENPKRYEGWFAAQAPTVRYEPEVWRYRRRTPVQPPVLTDPLMTEAERYSLVDEFLTSEEGKILLRKPRKKARRELGRVARVLYEKFHAGRL